VAGTFTLGVAIFPMSIDGKSDYGFVLNWIHLPFVSQLSLHGICAVLAFFFIALVIVRYADSTLSEIQTSNPTAYKAYKWIYRCIAGYMILSIAISIYLNYAHDGQGDYILSAETSGIWAFAAYWFVKNTELTKVGRQLKKRGTPLRAKTTADLADKL